MDLTDENLTILANYLQQTLSPDINVRRPAEKFLEGVEVNQNYPILLLNLVDKVEVDMTIRIAGSIAFKNYVKRNWEITDDQPNRIHESDRTAVKQFIVELMLRSPEGIQKQLSDAISIIGKFDFPNKWPELIGQMVEKFATGDFHMINGVLVTAHSLFKKYRHMFKSNELWTEIKLVLDKMAKPLTDLLLATMELATIHAENVQALKVIYSSLVLVCKVFNSLNFQDLPEFFEDNMAIWMENFHKLLTVQVKCLESPDDEEPGLIEQLRSQVCDNVTLYASKYDEEFQPFLPQFVTDVWELLYTTGPQPKYDMLVSNALLFLSTVADRNHYKNLFEAPGVLNSICEKVIIPNMEFRTTDEELFEDNPEEYIRRDIEGSDVDTRRRAACDLVNSLKNNFEAQIMEIFGQYIQIMLAKYAENPKQNWRSKDAALYLVTSLASHGQTQRHGVTKISQLVSIPQFGEQHIIPELISPNVNELPVLKADAIKYIMIFRSVVPHTMLIASLPHLIRHLQADSAVVHTYAACAIEKLLTVKIANNQPAIKSADLAPLANDLLIGLFTTMDKPRSEENEYFMKAVMRSIFVLQEVSVPYLGQILPKLTTKLQIVAKNPSRPQFNHYLFETISLSIKIVCKTNPAAVNSFEEALFPIFQLILSQDVQEFIPYVFQLISMLMELGGNATPGTVAEPYLALLPCLMAPVLWERQANTHPLVRLLCAFAMKAYSQIQDRVSGFLGVFQKLIASKSNDHEGFLLMQTMMQNFPPLTSSKTTKYVKGLIVFFCFYIVKYSATEFVNLIESIQPQMTGMVLEKIIVPDVQKVGGNIERKIAACGMIKLICECPIIFSGAYQKFWGPLVEALVCVLEMPQDDTVFADDHFIEVDDTPTFEQAYSNLNFAKSPQLDPLQGITDLRQLLAQGIGNLSAGNPNQLTNMIGALGSNYQIALKEYLGKYNVHVA
ncbi:exportin-2 isoform X2 [Chrysoperla carnea]|uniref:exportin-2 isoform X2 n=1 Tax=Chrysoperla carnea TaxID=189513 RepID=UPI001D07FD87|nr:exportin-2 isoform X2 [Chrysoperla carnea]